MMVACGDGFQEVMESLHQIPKNGIQGWIQKIGGEIVYA